MTYINILINDYTNNDNDEFMDSNNMIFCEVLFLLC